jgi:hypothetical protein
MAGMVFMSKGFPPGSSGYQFLTFVVAFVVVVATVTFLSFVGFEVFRSLRCVVVHGPRVRLACTGIACVWAHATARGRGHPLCVRAQVRKDPRGVSPRGGGPCGGGNARRAR